ncbi:MAG: hypothetical protein KDD51_08915 [Bdellovibrionales bacterium]|nr:hypothetical protein [Bdellovibrionales bacterium]
MKGFTLVICFSVLWWGASAATRRCWRRYHFSAHSWLSQLRRRRTLFAYFLAVAVVVAGGISVVLARPILGVVVLLLVPLLARVSFSVSEDQNQARLQGSALGFFTLLRVLVNDGEALPQALFQVAQRLRSPFSQHLGRTLRGFDAGLSVSECLGRFESRYPSGSAVYWVVLLDQAYRQGLPVLALLKSACRLLGAESAGLASVRRSREWALGQAIVAALLPWVLFAAYAVFQPILFSSFWGGFYGPACVTVALLMQVAGGWVVWKCTKFH